MLTNTEVGTKSSDLTDSGLDGDRGLSAKGSISLIGMLSSFLLIVSIDGPNERFKKLLE